LMFTLQPHVCRTLFPVASRRLLSSAAHSRFQKPSTRASLVWGSVFLVSASIALRPTIHLDSEVLSGVQIDPATSIEFPTTLTIPSKIPLPKFSLVGVGVRTVSFLSIKVYSVGFYADLDNPNLKISKSATSEEKIDHIVRNTACAIRIIPTRSTSYSHLRDGFMRALLARMKLSHTRDTITEKEEEAAQSPLRTLKSIFPNTPLAKHTPLDILITAPSKNSSQRALIIRDMGAVENDWIAREFVLAYFEGAGISPPLKMSVADRLASFGK